MVYPHNYTFTKFKRNSTLRPIKYDEVSILTVMKIWVWIILAASWWSHPCHQYLYTCKQNLLLVTFVKLHPVKESQIIGNDLTEFIIKQLFTPKYCKTFSYKVMHSCSHFDLKKMCYSLFHIVQPWSTLSVGFVLTFLNIMTGKYSWKKLSALINLWDLGLVEVCWLDESSRVVPFICWVNPLLGIV